MDRDAEYPLETVKKLGKMGIMGMPFPKEYGGSGLDYVTYVMAVEEISKICPSHGVIVQTHNALCCWPIFTYGTEEQKRKYLPDLLRGEKMERSDSLSLTQAPTPQCSRPSQRTRAITTC